MRCGRGVSLNRWLATVSGHDATQIICALASILLLTILARWILEWVIPWVLLLEQLLGVCSRAAPVGLGFRLLCFRWLFCETLTQWEYWRHFVTPRRMPTFVGQSTLRFLTERRSLDGDVFAAVVSLINLVVWRDCYTFTVFLMIHNAHCLDILNFWLQ